MTEQPEALRLADQMLHYWDERGPDAEEVAAELRRLHQSEREGWRYADELEQERKRLHSVNAQLLEALEAAHDESLDGNEFECRQILMAQIKALRLAIEQPHPTKHLSNHMNKQTPAEGLLEALERLIKASGPVANIAYNTGQGHRQWDTSIYPAVEALDREIVAALKVAAAARQSL